jgi:hypothetical protein
MVMTAYLDESGTHGTDSPAILMGGFIANTAGWSDYDRVMRGLLGAYDIEVFHAKKFRNGKLGIPRPERQPFMQS